MTLDPRTMHELPVPDHAAQIHSGRLAADIAREIGAGSIGFERYMELALYAPGLGYYMAGQRRFGAGGDFVTAPELSPAFGRCLAHAIDGVLGELGDGDVLELGAGSGRLAADILLAMLKGRRLPRRYYILEVSADLKALQQQSLRACLPPRVMGRINWLTRLPAAFQGVVIANEVADALPVTRFRVVDEQISELRTACVSGRLHDRVESADEELATRVRELFAGALPRLYESELSPRLAPWIGALAEAMHTGALLIVDYGYPRREYYSPDRTMGTLLCHYRHRVHGDPYWYPGLQDITASVDFTAVAEAAIAGGLELEGYCSQAAFLIDNGALEMAGENVGDSPRKITARQQLNTLLLPGEMGERFGVIGFSRRLQGAVSGFQFRSLTHRL